VPRRRSNVAWTAKSRATSFSGRTLAIASLGTSTLPLAKSALHEISGRAQPQALTTKSISTQAPSGRAATPITVRAGKG
jgi:hypothetical protein